MALQSPEHMMWKSQLPLRPFIQHVAVLALPFAAWLAFVVSFHRRWNRPGYSRDPLENADVVSAYNLALDIAQDKLAWLNWNLPPANYLFPEQFLLAWPAALHMPFDQALPLYAYGYFAILGVGSLWLVLSVTNLANAALATTAMLCLVGAMPALGVYPGFYLAAPNFHSGIILVLPFVLGLVTHSFVKPGAPFPLPAAITLGVLSTAIAFSDLLSVVQITIPLTLSLLSLAALAPDVRRKAFQFAGLLVASSLAGLACDLVLRPPNPGASVFPSPAEFPSNSLEMWRLAHDLRQTLPWIVICALATPVVAALALRKAIASQEWGQTVILAYVVFYYPLMHVVHAASTLEPVLHYRNLDLAIPALLLPTMLLCRAETQYLKKLSRLAVLSISVLSLTYSGTALKKRGFGVPILEPFVRCLDELSVKYNLHYGAAEYWWAIPVRALSRNDVTVISVGPDLAARDWNQSKVFDPGKPFEFIVLDDALKSFVHDHLPKPDAVVSCRGKPVNIYTGRN